MPHVVLPGDSIFDNAAYTRGEPIAQNSAYHDFCGVQFTGGRRGASGLRHAVAAQAGRRAALKYAYLRLG